MSSAETRAWAASEPGVFSSTAAASSRRRIARKYDDGARARCAPTAAGARRRSARARARAWSTRNAASGSATSVDVPPSGSMRGRKRRASARSSARAGLRLGGRVEQRAQIGIVARVARERRRALVGELELARAQVERRDVEDGALHLVAVGDEQLAERAPRRLAAARHGVPQRLGELLLALHVECVEALDDRRARAGPRARPRGSRWRPARASGWPTRCSRRPPRSSARSRRGGPSTRAARACPRPASRARPSRASTGCCRPCGEKRARTRRAAGSSSARSAGDTRGGHAPELGRLVEAERVAERVEDAVVRVVVLERRGPRAATSRA